ncbi:MAG TPA: hypothetical protein PKE47_00030 [Verrucomicrobiota bacterium]|nr:hypothetical protein [Verrucomicrobiota bacterium]
MLQLLRANIGLSISLGLLMAGMVVCTILGLIMTRSGASLRPIYWFAGFFALIVFPQVIGHFHKAVQTTKAEAPRTAALEQLAAPNDTNAATRSVDAKALFGPDVDPQLISDVRAAYGEVFAAADFAQFAVLPNGETVLLARLKSSSAAEKAWVNYLRVAGLQSGGKGDSRRGYAVTRPVGDRVYALPFGSMLGIWTGADDAAIRARMTAGGFEIPHHAPLADVAAGIQPPGKAVAASESSESSTASATITSHPPGWKPAATSLLRTVLIAAALVAYLFVVALYFFKGAAWAGTALAKPGVAPLNAGEVTHRLESVNDLNVPFQIERGPHPNEFFATWRYADTKWIDLHRARGMKRTLRIRMVLDEATRTVRATDYAASFDWSAGRGGANLEWKTGFGIVFFQSEHQRVFGLQLDEQGRLRPELNYAYTFNLQEMKSPLIEAVTRAGWNWRPTVWQGPTWLRWLTE